MTYIFQVREFNEFVGVYLDEIGEVIVEGEVSQLRLTNQGWLFLTLQDEEASLPVFGIRRQLANLAGLSEGMRVQVTGRPRLYQKTARFSLFAKKIVPAGEGALHQMREKLRRQLEAEGLFAPERKRPLPELPQKIGLLTAADSRAYSDFIKVSRERFGGLTIYFYPVIVQGDQAVTSIIAGLNHLNRHHPDLDFLVLTRGGGSLEDLQPFDDERLVRAVFASQIPVVAAIGHEADVSLVELAADLRASTPSNAAELTIPARKAVEQRRRQLENLLIQAMQNRWQEEKDRWQLLWQQIEEGISQQIQRVETSLWRFEQTGQLLQQICDRRQAVVEEKERQLGQLSRQIWRNNWQRWQNLNQLLQTLDYRHILRRGFSLTYHRHQLLRRADQVQANEWLTTILAQGRLKSKVKEVKCES